MPLTPAQRELLSRCFLFEGLPPEGFGEVTGGLSAEVYPAGEVIYSPRRFRRAMGVVLEGRLAVLKGKELLLKTLGPGQCFGAAAIFCPAEDYVTTVQAREPSAVVFLPDQWLVELFGAYPQTSVAYIAFLSQRIRFLNRKIDSFTAPSARETLYRHLLAAEVDGRVEVAGGSSPRAGGLHLGRASLSRALVARAVVGVIRREGRVIFLAGGG